EIRGVEPAQVREQERRIRDRLRMHPDAVLGKGDRDDAAAADETARRCDADERVVARGTSNREAGLGADADRGESDIDRDRRATARPPGVAAEVVGVEN